MDPVFQTMFDQVVENRAQWELINQRRITMGKSSKETDV